MLLPTSWISEFCDQLALDGWTHVGSSLKQRVFKGTPFQTLAKLQWRDNPTVTDEAMIARNFASREVDTGSREYVYLYNNGTLPVIITVGYDGSVVVIIRGIRLHQGTDLLSAMRVILNGRPCTGRSSSACYLYISNFTNITECRNCVELGKARSRNALKRKKEK